MIKKLYWQFIVSLVMYKPVFWFHQASLVDDLPSEIISKINLVDLAGR